ncbi:MAG: transcriptional regulator [Clostridiales bacterium]|nr:transcriptional regulator [Clostridiales bacterium]
MSIPQEGKLTAPRMCIFITRVEDEEKLEEIFDAMHIPISYQCRGQGTAPSELMDIFGLGGTTRLITVGFLPKFAVKELFQKTGRHIAFHQRGGGIVITIPITGLQSPLLHMLNEDSRTKIEKRIKERIESDMAELQEKSGFNAIWVSVAAGYSDEVIDTAREAGAKGGTILRGRRRNSEHVSQHFGVSMQDEQDFVMIIVPREKKSEIMSAICSACGLHTPAHGTIISLPIDEAIGLEE